MGSLTRYAAVFTGWRRLCLLTALLCGVATLAAADTHESGVTPAPVLGDLNGDGKDDVLLRHENGRWFYYPMDGRSHITDQRGYADLTRNLAWQFAGIGDLNGDERDDVLMRHTDGRWWYYPMDGRRHITAERGLAGLTRNLDWHVAGMGDLNGDGKDDVLLRNKNGRWYYYPMNGRRYITDERGYADLTRDLDWQFAGMGDLNGDGRDDVLLRHTDGRWDYYPMDGRNPIADQRGLAGLTRNLAWQVAGMGDLNGDGKDDVLLRHTDSRWYYYPMDGRRFLTDARGYAGLTRNLAWQVAGIGDLNGDGRDDVLLRHTDSRWYYYPMDGRRYLTDGRGYANLTRNPDWSIAGSDTLAPTGAPDLVVESPSVSDSTLTTGQSFTLSVTVRNRGMARADATTLRYYRSSDSTIFSSDTPAGTDAVGGLAASSSDDKSTTLTAPSSAGTYYYGACVESVSGESDTGNNCSSGVSVTVSDSQVDGDATRYAVGDVVTTLPTGSWFPDVTSGASFSLSGGNSVLNLGNGGYIEEGGYRYTCESTGGCEVRNGEVRAGTIVQTSTTTMPGDTQPRFAVANGPGNQSYRVGTAISALTLPEASGGEGTLVYSLTRDVPGLSFDTATRRLTGTPASAGTYNMTYTVEDADGDTDTLGFTITVEASGGGDADNDGVPDMDDPCPQDPDDTCDTATTALAPATQSEFDQRFDEKRLVEDDPANHTHFYFYRNFQETRGGETYSGTYTYTNTGANTGTLVFNYGFGDRDGDTCTFSITFDTRTTGSLSFTCNDDRTGESSWYLTDPPSISQRDGDFDLDPDDQPRGATYANGRLWIVNYVGADRHGAEGWHVHAYHTTGEPDEASGFSLDADNGDAFGIAYANERFYVVDHGDDKVYAYHASGSRDAASDFDLDPEVATPYGIAYANDRFYVLDRGRDTIWVHGISGQRDAAADFYLRSEDVDEGTVNPIGITYANGRLHIASYNNKVYAYHTSGQRDPASDFDLVANIATTPWWGIAYANDKFYLLHARHNTVYVYDAPTQAGGGDGSATRYAVGDVVTTLPTGTWFPDVTSGSASFVFSDGNSVLNLGNGGYIEEGGFRYTCESTGGCEVRNREVRVGTIVQTPSGVAPEETPPTSGAAGTCQVALGRSAGTGGTETVSVVLADALETNVGTLDAPFVVRARMDNSSDLDVYKIVLSDAGRLVVLSSGALDTQAVFLRSDCAEAGRVVEDVSVLEGFAADNYNFTLGGDLGPDTYYMVVFEWASRIGNYTLELGFASDDGVNDTPVIEPVASQEAAPGGTATVDVKVTDDTGDAHTIVAISDNDDVATVDLRGSGSSRSLVITTQAAGTATVTLRAADQEDAVASPVTFDVIVASPTLPAPALEPGSNAGDLEVTVVTTFAPRETRAHDYQIRVQRPQTPWHTVGCHAITNNSDGTVTGPFSVTLGNNPAGLTYEARYRYRNSSSCNSGSPGPWSAVGEGTSGGTATNATPAFPEGASTDRSVNENVGGGINVGSPVAASDADGVRDVLTYSLGGADAGSFQIVPATGQIRTRDGITYDHEARDTYFVTVEARDVHNATDLISVDIHIVDLGSICVSPPGLRLNSGDGELTVRWTPLADQAGSAAVRGYEIERRDGTGGVWGSRQIIGGRASSNTTYTGLVNGRQYDVRIRPFGNEDACDWSTPVSGIPTTDTAPQDQSDFEDRVPPGTQLRDWRFPVPGRFSETRDGRQLDGSYRYMRTDANRGTITLEYDEIGRAGCEISLLFSSLTSGSFLDECEGAGVNVDVDFDIEETPAPSSPLAPQTMEEFDALVLGQENTILPGFGFGYGFSARLGTRLGGPASGYAYRIVGNLDANLVGSYAYESAGPNSGVLTVRFGCRCPRDEWGDNNRDNNEEWVFELTFLSSDAAGYTVTIYREGQPPLTLNGFIDFKSGDNLNSFPPELLPPGSPPQASGNDLFGVDAATGSTSLSIGDDSLQTILVQDGGIQDIAYQPGDWLEPKDGGNQRMMIVGPGQTAAPVAAGLVVRARTPAQARTVPQATGQTDLIALSVVCMQFEKGIPARGSRFFSQPKSPDGTVQMCQRNCVVAGGNALQRCVWDCQNSADGAAAVVNDSGGTAVRQVFDTLGGRGVGGQIRSGVRSSGENLKSRLFRID